MVLSATATKIIVSISLFEKTFNSCLLWNSSLYYDFYKPFVFFLASNIQFNRLFTFYLNIQPE